MPRRGLSKEQREHNEGLGRRIAAIRKERGLTQVEIAAAVAVGQSIISTYESGRLRPHPEMLLKLSEVLDISTDELLGRTPRGKSRDKRSLPRRLLRRVELMGKLPKRDQDTLIRTIDTFLKLHLAGAER